MELIKNNNQLEEENVIDIPSGKYDISELIMTINGLFQNDKGFFKASFKDGKVIIEIIKSAYSIDFSKQNTLANVFGFDNKILTHGKHVSENKHSSKTVDNVFIWCNLIDDSYINNRKMNSIYKFRLNPQISIEPRQIIYHKLASRPNKIMLKLVDINNNLIEFDSINLFVELNMIEFKK